MEEHEGRVMSEKQDLHLKGKVTCEDDDVQFLGRGTILHPKVAVGRIDLVTTIQARDVVDKLHDLQVLWSKSGEYGRGQMHTFRAFKEG